jgi:hypothetical protein
VADEARLVLPAFGVLTGGLNALDPAFAALFPDGFDAWLLGERRVFRFPQRALSPELTIYSTVQRDLVTAR